MATSSTSSRISTARMTDIMDQLSRERFRDSTKRNYYAIWKIFNQFIVRLDVIPKHWEERIPLFVAHLIESKKQSSTIRSYLSGIRATLKDAGIKLNEDHYLVSSLTKACKLRNNKVLVRLPIYKSLLQVIINETKKHFFAQSQPYLAKLYSAIFATLYYGMFRIGELTQSKHAVKARDVLLAKNKRKMMFILRSAKNLYPGDKPQLIKIEAMGRKYCGKTPEGLDISCPYYLLRDYLWVRDTSCGQNELFFCFRSGIPVQAHHVRSVLKTILKKAGFNAKLYSTHSMRIGRCGDLLRMGISVETIKKLGRWHSNAVFDYLRDL